MTRSEDLATTQDKHVAPMEAWDEIAAGYDRHVAPTEGPLAI